MSLLWEVSLTAFLLITIFVGGGAAWMSGRGIALTWRPMKQILLYMVLLSAAVRFLHFSLFEGTLLSLHYYLVDFAILLAICWLGHRHTRAEQMTRQYHWIYQKVGPFNWRKRKAD